MKNIPFFILIFLLFQNNITAENKMDSLLTVLDETIDNASIYDKSKEDKLNNLKQFLSLPNSTENTLEIYTRIFKEYINYNSDSAMLYVRRKMEIAEKSNDVKIKTESEINLVSMLTISGLYIEALELVKKINVSKIPELKADYFQACRNLYGDLAVYASSDAEKLHYEDSIDSYRDSLLSIYPKDSYNYNLVLSDKFNRFGRFDEALAITLPYFLTLPEDSHQRGSLAFNIAMSYKGKHETENENIWYAFSAINDLKASVKEHISLREVALFLYGKGDIKRAYKYTRKSLEDALKCNAKAQTYKIAEILPIIDKANVSLLEREKRQNFILFIILGLFSIILLAGIIYLYKQKTKLTKARNELSVANSQLNDLNHDLYLINIQQQRSNKDLIESNQIKEEYIGKYLDQCSVYINKMEDYRRLLNKFAQNGKIDNLLEELKSKDFIEKEFKEFYENFDETFLQLFPTFVEDFLNLLSTSDVINLKPGHLLNTELRIFALIRLGINDSVKISHFLGYSLSTIYNYKAKIKFKAKGDKEEFENNVMKIGLK